MPAKSLVHIVDDDTAVRQSLEFLLRTGGIESVGHETAQSLLDALPTAGVGCIVTDIRMPGMNGLELMAELKQRGNTAPVIVITGHGDVPLAVEAMKLGASDFLEKPFDDEVILSAVGAALTRRKDQALQEAERLEIAARIEALTNRERQVLEGLVQGHPNKTIAYDLNISARTVEIYRANVMSKMRANSLSDLVRMSMAAGLSGSH